MYRILTLFFGVMLFFSCNTRVDKVRVIENKIIVTKTDKGQYIYDTISSLAPIFCLQSHFGKEFCSNELNGKIYVVDFFFTHCPSICIAMKKNMLKLHEKYGDNSGIEIVSFSIDPKRDSVVVLFDYARKLGVEHTNWTFLTGEKDSIYEIAERFLALASEDENSPGGFIHDGNFILVDEKGRIRGFYDGTVSESVDKLIEDIATLKKQK
jgi:protein SCO1/2